MATTGNAENRPLSAPRLTAVKTVAAMGDAPALFCALTPVCLYQWNNKEDGEAGSWLSSKAIYLPRYEVSPNNYCKYASLNGIMLRPAWIPFVYWPIAWENFAGFCARNVMGFYGERSVGRGALPAPSTT